jgi:hypothetical protein
MFVNNKLVGVTSGGGPSSQSGKDISFYVDLTTAASKKFLAYARSQGADIPADLSDQNAGTANDSDSDSDSDSGSGNAGNDGANSDGDSQGKLLGCNSDYIKIRTSGESGICLNASSGFCYRYGGGSVLYSGGSVSCNTSAGDSIFSDSDGDGISDKDDLCSRTAPNARVWQEGEWIGCAGGQYRDR